MPCFPFNLSREKVYICFFLAWAWNVEVSRGGGSNSLRDANYYPDQFRTTLYFLQKLAGSARCKSQVVCERNFGGKLLNYLLSRVIQHNLAINREKIDHKSVSFWALRNLKLNSICFLHKRCSKNFTQKVANLLISFGIPCNELLIFFYGQNRNRKNQYLFQETFENMGLQLADGRPMTLCSETWNKLQLDGSQNKLSFKIIFTKYIILPDNSQNRLASKSVHKIM